MNGEEYTKGKIYHDNGKMIIEDECIYTEPLGKGEIYLNDD